MARKDWERVQRSFRIELRKAQAEGREHARRRRARIHVARDQEHRAHWAAMRQELGI